MPIPEPFTVVAITGSIAANLATDILKHYTKGISNTRVAVLLKQCGLRELDFQERVQQILAQALEVYFDKHEAFRIHGVLEFFRKPDIASMIANYAIEAEHINESELIKSFESHFIQYIPSQLILENLKLEATRVIPDFLQCYRQVLTHGSVRFRLV